MDQLDLFAASRPSDPITSHLAAADAQRTAPTLRQRCLDALTAAGPAGLTDFALGDIVHAPQTSAGKRRLELQRLGLVEPVIDATGLQVRRPSPTGSAALVWRAA